MKRLAAVSVFSLIFLISVSSAAINTFESPPETNPNITWQTAFPYQRNMLLDFSVNPVGTTGPIPGADYAGYDDPSLWDSDFVTTSGDVVWNEEKGGIGIFGGGSGTIIFHFDNWQRDWPIKHFYEEFAFQVEIASGSIYQELVTPSGVIEEPQWSNVTNAGGGLYKVQAWYELQPNPPWEEKVYTLNSANGNIYIDTFHIATECIPEPTTICLLGLGSLALLRRRKA